MKDIGAFEAKTHFSELLRNVGKGESYVITKHGQKVAMLVPIEDYQSADERAQTAIQAIREHRKKITLGDKLSIRSMREEGRK